jgi:hypothetical protein
MDAIDDKRVAHSLRLGWAALCVYQESVDLAPLEWFKITDLSDFWLWVAKIAIEHKQVRVIAHNIAYDARILNAFSILPGIGFTPDFGIMGQSCTFFTFVADDTKIHLLDNSNYWQGSLNQLGQEFGIAKGHVDFDTATDVELSEYCKRDVEILIRVWQFWLQCLDDYDLGDFAITVAGQAWNAYRHRFMHHQIGIHNHKPACDLERASYKGGRVEVFKVGKFNGQQYYKLDVNGLYAYCMQEYPYPTKLHKVVIGRDAVETTWLANRFLCIADVILDTDQPFYPVKMNGQNAYPVGVFRTALTTPELRKALAYGHVRAIGQVNLYKSGMLFDDFIGTLTPLRQKHKASGDTGRSAIFKMLRNSLYGKFAQRGYKQTIIGDAPLQDVKIVKWIDAETGDKCEDWTFGGKVIRQERTGESDDSFPAISSHVSAYARTYMLMLIETIDWRNVLYMDTDCLIVTEQGYQRLAPYIDNVKLGHLKVELVSDSLEIIAKKAYIMGEKRVDKGIKKDAIEIAPGVFQQWHFEGLGHGFLAGDLDSVMTYQVEKRRASAVIAGTVHPDGVVTPAQVSMRFEQVCEIVQPESKHTRTWWVDAQWLASLSSESDLWNQPRILSPPFLYSS